MTTSDDDHRTTDWRTAALLIAPAMLVGALVAHPYIEGRLRNDDAWRRRWRPEPCCGAPSTSPPPWRQH